MDKNQILITLSSSDKTSYRREAFASQTQPQKVFSAIWDLESEVNNGGFSQYFLNSSAESASFVAKALEIVGASQTASICQRAITTAFPNGLPSAPDEIQATAMNFADDILANLEQLDQEFFEYPHDLTDLLFALCLSIRMSLDLCRNHSPSQ